MQLSRRISELEVISKVLQSSLHLRLKTPSATCLGGGMNAPLLECSWGWGACSLSRQLVSVQLLQEKILPCLEAHPVFLPLQPMALEPLDPNRTNCIFCPQGSTSVICQDPSCSPPPALTPPFHCYLSQFLQLLLSGHAFESTPSMGCISPKENLEFVFVLPKSVAHS